MSDKKYTVVGVMSGTSLDGLDLVLCEFRKDDLNWSFEVVKGATVEYTSEWKEKLASAQQLSAYDFVKLHRAYGSLIGREVNRFLADLRVDFIASHGHTVFHEPQNHVTFQLGCGAYLAAACAHKTISDFRTLDIALQGQGAPLVPIGDQLLFNDYDACINLGGFANISFDDEQSQRVAFDICPVNIVLNQLMEMNYQLSFDRNGEKGRGGRVNQELLLLLNKLDFYKQTGPKSLGREWVETIFNPLFLRVKNISPQDLLTTCYHHFAKQIADVISSRRLKNVLFTGGGTYNGFLMELVGHMCDAHIVIPEKGIIDYKEAIIFAFLGVLKVEGEVNCLATVTGARQNNIGGAEVLM
jgi:anhydro-N-acetylmuramic acid kinase